jgi:serine/threonine protein kinase
LPGDGADFGDGLRRVYQRAQATDRPENSHRLASSVDSDPPPNSRSRYFSWQYQAFQYHSPTRWAISHDRFRRSQAAANIFTKGTRIYPPGVVAIEQERGKTFAQSDFFALGRTFVYLLTSKDPIDLQDPDRDVLIWRDRVPHVSSDFLDLIDQLIHEDPHQRPDTTATIFNEIAALPPIVTGRISSDMPKPAHSTHTDSRQPCNPPILTASTPDLQKIATSFAGIDCAPTIINRCG